MDILKRLRFYLLVIIYLALISFHQYASFIGPYISQIHFLKSSRVEVKYDQKQKEVHYFIKKKIKSKWIPINKISKPAVWAIVLSEDWAFFRHEGIDFSQLTDAIYNFLADGKKMRGASTISQQLVKNLFFRDDHKYSRKVKEWILVNYLEDILNKRDILEVYLNIIEFGEGLYGIENAASFYFNKSASELNAKEGAFLAMLLPSPKRYAESFRKKKLTKFANGIIEDLLAKMKLAKKLEEEDYLRIKDKPLSFEEIGKEPLEALESANTPQSEEIYYEYEY